MLECEERKQEHEDMRKMLNGFLPLKIIDIFNDRLKENPELYSRFSGSISNSKQCASENAVSFVFSYYLQQIQALIIS